MPFPCQPALSHPSRPQQGLPLPCRLPGHSSPKDPLPSWASWTKSVLAARTEDIHPPVRGLIPSPFNAQGQCSLPSPLFCMVRSPTSDPSHHTNMLLFLLFSGGEARNNFWIPLQLHPIALCFPFARTKPKQVKSCLYSYFWFLPFGSLLHPLQPGSHTPSSATQAPANHAPS